MTRPRVRNDRYTGFTVVDPGGNWIRVDKAAVEPEARTPLARAMENAARQADARGDERQALKILEGALRRAEPSAERDEAEAFREELVERISGSVPTESGPRPGA